MRKMAWVVAMICLAASAAVAGEARLTAPEFGGDEGLKTFIAGFYEPVDVKVKARAAQYKLPLDLEQVTNRKAAAAWLKRLAGLEAKLKKNGFAAGPARRGDDVVAFYKSMKTSGTPIFVTSDSLLHLYHIQFDETLKHIEETEFFDDALALSVGLKKRSEELYGRLDGEEKEAARRCVGFFTVPALLLAEDTISGGVDEAIEHVRTWPEKRYWQKAREFQSKYRNLVEAMTERKLIRQRDVRNKAKLLAGLRKLKSQAKPAAKVTVPDAVAEEVTAELELIAAHKGFARSPLFRYQEDYSQYVPRGHYTRSEKLKKYFKAFMWFGRLTFLIKGKRPGSADQALVSQKEARIQTKAAVLITSMLGTAKLDRGRTARQVWERIYRVTAYYVGLADDLTPGEYGGAMRDAFGAQFATAALGDKDKWFAFRKALAEMRPPKIYSGTGDIVGPPVEIANEKTLADALEQTKGLRLMGQRYIPDSYMMGQLVYPTVGKFTGEGTPFTLVISDGGPIRGFPRGLDVLAVLGSDRARALIKQLGDDQYKKYDETLARLRKEFGGLSKSDWNRNLYWSWLYALKALLEVPHDGYPTFMGTDAWLDKQVNAALGSWAQLRHDTILYAKQSYTMTATGMPARPRMVEGYVEPVPEFYARLLALTRMTRRGLGAMDVLDKPATHRLASLETIIERLLAISRAELANKKLTKDDYAFIRSFGDQLKSAVAGVSTDGLQTTIIADVHTDGNSKQVLEEGTGMLRPLYVAYPMPDGGVVIGCGPAFSYYEFKHPMRHRLTDEAWKQMLRRPDTTPALPAWTDSFGVSAR
ncbi:MAG: DUF3160 domain-containing protein [Planctomycetota bacterium]